MTDIPEARAHYDGFVPMLFVIVEDLLDGLDAGVVIAFVRFPSALLVPVEDLPI